MTPAFRRGDLRLFLLGALEDGAKHGYELMRVLEERFAGLYRPSAGSIYPRLSALVDAGLVSRDGRDYALTAAGRGEVDERREELRTLATDVARRTDIRGASRALRAEVRAAAAEVRSQQHRAQREARTHHEQKSASVASLRVELRVFAADVMAAARRAAPGPEAIARVLAALDEARAQVLAALTDH